MEDYEEVRASQDMQVIVYKITRTVCGKHCGTFVEPITDKDVL